MEPRHDPGAFNTFLDSLQSHGVVEQRPEQSDQVPTIDSLKILANLARSESEPISALMEESGLGFAKFAQTLEAMEKKSLVTIVGEPGHESAEITPTGKQLAQQLASIIGP